MNRKMAATALLIIMLLGTFSTVLIGTLKFAKADSNQSSDSNGNPYPQTPTSGLDPWDSNTPPGVPQNLIVGKVIITDYG